MNNVALLVGYDGTSYAGFQIQPTLATVQGAIESVLCDMLGAPIRVGAAGRTDAGVHAFGQVVNFSSDFQADRVMGELNARLPRDISILEAAAVDGTFHARHSARERTYIYLLRTSAVRHPILDRFMYTEARSIDTDALDSALSRIVGTHDFSSLARVRADQDPVRTVTSASCSVDGDVVAIRISAVSFLHQMVRGIVGTALEVATGRKPASYTDFVLQSRDRSAAGNLAPAHGLALVDVAYEDLVFETPLSSRWPWAAKQLCTTGGAVL